MRAPEIRFRTKNVYPEIQTGQVPDLELIENYVQYMTIKEFGFEPSEVSLRNYRLINYKFGEQVTDYAFYLKYNIMKDELVPGTIVDTDDIQLVKHADQSVWNFNHVCKDNQLSLIFSGSIT